MRVLLPNIITKEDASTLLLAPLRKTYSYSWNNPIVNSIVDILDTYLPSRISLNLSGSSYWRRDNRTGKKAERGFPWHYDGCREEEGALKKNHMSWCEYSASVLLTHPDGFSGGTFRFAKPSEEHREDHYLSAVFYSSGSNNEPQLHMVDPHEGVRTVLLMFFATSDNLTTKSHKKNYRQM